VWYVGLDVHQRMSCVCILDENGKVIKEQKIVGPSALVLQELREVPQRFAICYEASCGYGYLHDQLRRFAARVVVAHPAKVRSIFQCKRKTDRIDAKKLATLLFLDQIPAVHVPGMDVRGWRGAIEFRQRLIGRRTQMKNGLRALLRGQGVVLPAGKSLWTAKGLAWLERLELPDIAALQRDMLLDDLRRISPKIKVVERILKKRGDAHPGVVVLKTIPGVGIRTAEAVVAYIDDARRFARNKQIGAYFGLVPCEDTSVKQRLGHITCDGPATVRKLLTEAAWQAIRRDASVRKRFERIHAGKPDRRKIAIVAIAHYLARVMLAMLRTGECWRSQEADEKAAA
jgi:transposase